MPTGINLAAIRIMNWKIGCSGYYYPEWRGLFYPLDLPKADWFSFYCRHFNAIELNTTFYRFPRVEYLGGWHGKSPEEFKFSVKVPRAITHYKRLRDARHFISDFYGAVRNGLREKLGPVLFQFPGNFVYDENRLDKIVRLVNPSFRNVMEFRHESWWNAKVFERFTEANLIFSGMDHPQLPSDIVKTADVIYHRFHGRPHLYVSEYASAELERTMRAVHQLAGVGDAFIFFNNTSEGAALVNARHFQLLAEPVHHDKKRTFQP